MAGPLHGFSPQDILHQQDLLKLRLAAIPPYPAERFAGSGIVICAGGARIFTSAYVLVSVLRRVLGCALPIEVWHFGRSELSECMAGLLEDLQCELVDAEQHLRVRPANVSNGWQLKPYAIINARFANVLYLDADQVPVRDPADLFGWPEFGQTGAVFWPDRIDISAANPIWQVVGPAERQASFESGQILVEKRRHWTALNIALHLNEQAEFFYRTVYGDKDTFLAGCICAGQPFTLVPHRPIVDEHCLFQRDFTGHIVFQHRTGAKWSYNGSQTTIRGFVHHEACLAALAELRRRWNGRIFHPPVRSRRAEEAEARIVAHGRYRNTRPGEPDFDLELLPHSQMGAGRALNRQNWYVTEEEAGPVMWLCGVDMAVASLHPEADGSWSGTMLADPDQTIGLRPLGLSNGFPVIESGLARAVVKTATAAGSWTDVAADDLLAALPFLARLQPGLADELARIVLARCDHEAVRTRLLAGLAQFTAQQRIRGEGPRSDPDMLFDPTRYRS